MFNINFRAVGVAAVASFVGSAIWYMIFGDAMGGLQKQWRNAEPADTQPWMMLGFLAAGLVLAGSVAYLFELADVSGLPSSIGLGLVLWLGFCATQWFSSILGEQVPLKLAAIHAGDWLVHLLTITTIVGLWRRSRRPRSAKRLSTASGK